MNEDRIRMPTSSVHSVVRDWYEAKLTRRELKLIRETETELAAFKAKHAAAPRLPRMPATLWKRVRQSVDALIRVRNAIDTGVYVLDQTGECVEGAPMVEGVAAHAFLPGEAMAAAFPTVCYE